MKFNQTAAAALVALMALPLAGCPMYPSAAYTPVPYPYKPPVADRLNGPSLSDAYHDVERWLGSHYPGARLLSVEGPAVGRSGRSGGKGWTFKYAATSEDEAQPQPYPVLTPTPAPVPMPRPTSKPRYVLEPGEQYGPPADEAPLVGNQTGDLVTNNAFLVGNDDEPQILPIRKMPPVATPAPVMPRPVKPPSYTTRYFAITVDGAGRLLAPEDLAEPVNGGPEPAVMAAAAGGSDFLGDRISIMPVPAPTPQGIEFTRTVSLVKLLGAVEDLGYSISPAGVKVSIRHDAGRGAVVEIDPQVAVRDTTPAGYPNYGEYGPEPSDGPYAAAANRGPGYGVKCVAPPSQPWPYETSPDGVLYRGSYLFNAYTGELISRPGRI